MTRFCLHAISPDMWLDPPPPPLWSLFIVENVGFFVSVETVKDGICDWSVLVLIGIMTHQREY